jgi:hypothetical protein
MEIGLKAGTLGRNMRRLLALYALECITIGSEWKNSRIKYTELEMTNVRNGPASMEHYAPRTSGLVEIVQEAYMNFGGPEMAFGNCKSANLI